MKWVSFKVNRNQAEAKFLALYFWRSYHFLLVPIPHTPIFAEQKEKVKKNEEGTERKKEGNRKIKRKELKIKKKKTV